MTQKPAIVCIGNCQSGSLRAFLATVPEISRDYDVVFVRSKPGFKAVRERAAAVIQQVTHGWDGFKMSREDLPPGVVLIRYPACLMNYPWPLIPFQKRDGSDRRPQFALFPYTVCDDLVIRLAEQGVPRENLLEAYFAIDVVRRFPLDRLREINAAKARQVDAMADFGVWDLCESGAQMFRTANHPNGSLLAYVFEQVLERLPLEDRPYALKLARSRASGVGIQPVEAPVHPQVADHFGLAWARDRRWTFWNEGDFTFEEHLLRLYDRRYSTNLHLGVERLKRKEDAAALLAEAVNELPGSAAALEMYIAALRAAGRHEEVIPALRRLNDLAPTPRNADDLFVTLRRANRVDEAEAFLAGLPPAIATHPRLLVCRSRDARERDPALADALLDQAAQGDPDNLSVLVEQAARHEAEGRLDAALICSERAWYVSNWSSSIGRKLDALRARQSLT